MRKADMLWLGLSLGGVACSDASPSRRPDAGAQPDLDAEVSDGGQSDAGNTPLPDGGDALDASPQRSYVTIRFRARVGSEDFACDRTYQTLGTEAVEAEPVDLRLFVQDMALIRKRDGVEVPLELDERTGVQRKDVTLLDFEDNQGFCVGVGGTPELNTTVTGWVPTDEYAGVVFSNGVPEQVNHQNPIELTSPLVAGPLHWNWNGGFLFINAQVRQHVKRGTDGGPDEDGGPSHDAGHGFDAGGASTDGGLQANDAGHHPHDPVYDAGMHGHGGGGPGGSATMHIGSTECVPNMGCKKSNRNRITLPDFRHDRDSVVLDVAAMFAQVSLAQTTPCHAMGAACEAFFPALGIDYGTGKATATQTLYRVEPGE